MNLKKALPTYILLIFIPAVFGLFLYFCILNIEKKHEIENIKQKLSERAVDFMAQANAVDYFHHYFNQLSDNIFPYLENRPNSLGQTLTLQDLSTTIASLSLTINENIRCAIFNEKGTIINKNDLLDYEIRFFDYAWKEIHKIPNADYEDRRIDQTTVLGRDFNVEQMRDYDERCLLTSNFGTTGVFYFKNANKYLNGIIAFTEYKRTNLELVQAKVKEWHSNDQPIILYHSENGKLIADNDTYKIISAEETNTDKFLNGFQIGNMVWKGFKSDYYKILLGEKYNKANLHNNYIIIGITVFLISLLFISIFYFKNLSSTNGVRISIRYKLIAIFLLAIYMPTLSLWILSKTSLHDHRIAIENNAKKGMLNIASKIDQDYENCVKEANDGYIELDNYLKSFSGKPAPSFEEIENKLVEISNKQHKDINAIFNWVDVRTINQEQIYTTSNTESNGRLEKIGRVISVLCLEKHCPSRLSKAGVKPTQSDILVGNLFENPMVGFSGVFERPKVQVQQIFQGSSVYWWWNYIPDENNEIAFIIGNSAMRFMTTAYLKTVLPKRFTYENANLKIANFCITNQTFLPDSAWQYPDLMKLINVSNISKTVESSVVNYENNKYLCLCYPGSKMLDNFILCMYPISEIDYKISKVQSTIYTVMILLLAISILTGLLLSKTFIVPVKELERGLQALRKRETNTTIKIENKDELGNLGNAFNQMMADIKDMLMAGAIQQCLIPTGKYNIEGYDCCIYNQMATDVGGDYADIFELPNDRLLIVIGDVTGHGVSSALLTAMVKASIFRFAQKNTPLSEIATNTSNMINDLLNKKKLMTFCAITLDKNSGEMAICNAGHPYPMIHTQKGILRTPSKNGLPLGISKKRCRYNAEEEKLAPGETLILYTDGFPEAENAEKVEFGYNEFQKFITDEEINTSEELQKHLLEAFHNHHGDAELADDVTFIILKRNKQETVA